MKNIEAVSVGNWLSRILRWALGLLFLGMAWFLEDAEPLYFFGALLFISGFFKPRRCTDSSCNV